MEMRSHEFRLHSQQLLQSAIESAERMQDGKTDVITTALMASASAEAFIHEVNYLLTLTGLPGHHLNQAGRPPQLPKSFRDKYNFVLKDLLLDFSWDKEPFANLALIYSLRNRITHFNHIDETVIQGDDSPTQILMPEVINKLDSMHLLRKVPKESYYNWFDLIQTKRLAWWICRNTRDSIVKILIDIPEDFSEYFATWRKLALTDLPSEPITKKLEREASELTLLNEKIAYRITKDNKIFYTCLASNVTSSINNAEEIINDICIREDINPKEYMFYDLLTHLGYPGGHGAGYHSGEYMVIQPEIAERDGALQIIGCKDILEARILEGDLHLFEKDESQQDIKEQINAFSLLIGKVAPF